MINQVIVEQKERKEPASLKEGLTRMESARAALFTVMSHKYVDPLETDYEPLGMKKEAGKTYFYRDSKKLFSIEADTFVTKKSDPSVTYQMISLIADQGNKGIKVKGKHEFRKQAWLYATLRGLEVEGYSPTKKDELLLEYGRSRQNTILPESNLEKSKTTQETIPNEGLDASPNEGKKGTDQAPESGKSSKSENPSEEAFRQEPQNPKPNEVESPGRTQATLTTPTPREQKDQLWDWVAQLRYADSGEFYQALFENAAELPSEVALKALQNHLPEGQYRPMAETLLAGLVSTSRSPYVKSVLEHLPHPVEQPENFANLYRDYRKASEKRDQAHASGAFKDAQQAQIAINRIESKVYALAVQQASPIEETRINEPTPLPFSSSDRHIVDEYLNPQRWAEVNKERAIREKEFGHHSEILHVENSMPSQSEKDLNLFKRRDELKEKVGQCIVEGHHDPARWYRHEMNLIELEILWLSTGQPVDLKQIYPVAGEPLVLTPSQAEMVKSTPEFEAIATTADGPKSVQIPHSNEDDALLAPVVLPPCLSQLKEQAAEVLSEIQDAALLYGDRFYDYRSRVEASVQSKLDADPSNQENASLIIDFLSKSYDVAAPMLLEGLDISALKNDMMQRFEDRKREIENAISKNTPLDASVAVEHETLLENLKRLKTPSKVQRNNQVSVA
jgi:hypothetical protein